MKKTFRLIKPDGDVDITYCKGNAHFEKRDKDDPGRMTFTLESPDAVFKFILLKPSKEDQKLMAKDVDGLAVRYVLFRNGRKISSPDFVSCGSVELPADERTARHSAETHKASEATAKALEQLAADRTENTKLTERIKKAEAASCATMKEAVEHLNRLAGGVDSRIVTAAQLYVQPEWRTLQKVADKMMVSKATISKWFNLFEDKTGFSLGRPKPGANFSVRAETEVAHLSGNARGRTRMIEPQPDDDQDAFTEHDEHAND